MCDSQHTSLSGPAAPRNESQTFDKPKLLDLLNELNEKGDHDLSTKLRITAELKNIQNLITSEQPSGGHHQLATEQHHQSIPRPPRYKMELLRTLKKQLDHERDPLTKLRITIALKAVLSYPNPPDTEQHSLSTPFPPDAEAYLIFRTIRDIVVREPKFYVMTQK